MARRRKRKALPHALNPRRHRRGMHPLRFFSGITHVKSDGSRRNFQYLSIDQCYIYSENCVTLTPRLVTCDLFLKVMLGDHSDPEHISAHNSRVSSLLMIRSMQTCDTM